VRLFRSQEDKQAASAAEDAFRQLIAQLETADPNRARELVAELSSNPQFAALSDRQRRKLGEQAFLRYTETVLADDHLTADEETSFAALAQAVGLTQEDVEKHSDLYLRLQIATLNAGRLPVVSDPSLIPKKGEVVHLETAAGLLKEVAVREWRGGSQGVSFRVAKGVRYRVGSTRGHIVTVGSQLQVSDTGTLAVTSQRVAYLGTRKTVDMPYSKLIGMHLYTDAIRFSLSNRQNAPLVKVTMNTDVLGALINGAIQAAS
jgi:hypothetical protein